MSLLSQLIGSFRYRLKLLPFRAFCVGDLSQIDDVRPLSSASVRVTLIIGDDASSAITIADYDDHTKISGKSVHFHSFSVLWAL